MKLKKYFAALLAANLLLGGVAAAEEPEMALEAEKAMAAEFDGENTQSLELDEKAKPKKKKGKEAEEVKKTKIVTTVEPVEVEPISEQRALLVEATAKYTEAKAANIPSPTKNEALTEALATIDKAVALAPEDPLTNVLAAQIYRMRGGVSHARTYYGKALKLYEDRVKAEPENVNSVLSLAVLCYLTDNYFVIDYEPYQNKAAYYANKARELLESESEDKVRFNAFTEPAVQEQFNMQDKQSHLQLIGLLVDGMILQDEELQQQAVTGLEAEVADHGDFKNALADYTKAKEGEWQWPLRLTGAAQREYILNLMRPTMIVEKIEVEVEEEPEEVAGEGTVNTEGEAEVNAEGEATDAEAEVNAEGEATDAEAKDVVETAKAIR